MKAIGYIQIGSYSAPVYELTQNNFIQENTIDLGESAYPTVFDYNNDGLLDLVVAITDIIKVTKLHLKPCPF